MSLSRRKTGRKTYEIGPGGKWCTIDVDVTFSKSRIDIHYNFITDVIGIHYHFITDVIVHNVSRRFTTFSVEETALLFLYISNVGLLAVASLLSPNVNFTLFKMYSVVLFIVGH